MGDEDDIRAEEMQLLQAIYCNDGEFRPDKGDPFACTLLLTVGDEGGEGEGGQLELEVTLPDGYPQQPPLLRASGARLSRTGQDALARGMLEAFKESEEQACPCMSAVLEWLQENAGGWLDAPAPPLEEVAPKADTKPRGQALRGASCALWEERGDLFEVAPEWSLCHCVSKDLEMGAGIAVTFKKQFGGLPELLAQGPEVGGVLALQKKGRFVYYLVTKNKHGGKPCPETLEASLRAMKSRMAQDGVRKLAMPKIGCGLDKLSWGTVVDIIMRVFDDMDVELLVRYI